MDGHRYITERLRNRCTPETPPELRAVMNEAATVIEGRDRALDNTTAFSHLKQIVAHWNEFGHEHGLDERMEEADKFIRLATAG